MDAEKTVSIVNGSIRVTSIKIVTKKEELHKLPRIYMFLNDSNVSEDLFSERRNKPHNDLKPLLNDLLSQCGIDTSKFIFRWNQNAGCKCGCSPGFIVGCVDTSWDAYINYEYNICRRCGSALVDGKCSDKTCPFSDHRQPCPKGWIGHPDYSEINDETLCTCGH